jgi:hypothetical protein
MKIRWVILLVLAAIAGTWLWTHDRHQSGNDAVLAMMDSGKLSFTAQQVTPTQVKVSVVRPAGSNGDIHFVIPAGTIVYPSSDGAQRMVIAVAVAVDMGADDSARDYTVEGYCLDQFLDPPLDGELLAFRDSRSSGEGQDSRVVSDSGVDVSELMPCLEAQAGSHAQRQFALWIVEGNYLDLLPGEAEDRMVSKYADNLRQKATDALNGKFRQQVLSSMPNATPDQVDEALEQFIRNDLEGQVSERARRMAHSDIIGMQNPVVQAMLDNCKVETAGKSLFA